MDSLVGYGSEEENDIDRREYYPVGSRSGGSRRRDDDTNYDDVNMDLSEESQQGEESEPELPQVEHNRHYDDERRSRDGSHRDSNSDSSERRRDSPSMYRRDRSPRRDDRRPRNDRGHHSGSSSRRGLLGERPDDYRPSDNHKLPSLMDLNTHSGESRSHDTRDAVSPRFVDRDRRDRERERDRDRHNRRSEEKSSRRSDRRSRSRDRYDRGDKYKLRNAFPPPDSSDGRSPNSHYHSASYKVNKKLDVMEKMGLQIKTPDGSMTTAQQLRQATIEPGSLPTYCTTNNVNANRIMDQVQKRKLLWSNKNKNPQAEAATWSGTKFAQDNDGKQAEKFMRLMGIKEPVKPAADKPCDPNKKQEEMFQAMQAQYEVARATTHTMRGVGLGFQRGQF